MIPPSLFRGYSLFILLTFLQAAFLASTRPAHSQQQSSPPNPKPQSPAPANPSGMATGGVHAPIKDALSRAIAAGGFVDGVPIVFAEITRQSGLDKFHHRSSTPEKSTIIDAPGSGVALLDYDNDGWLDIYLLKGSTASAMKGKEPPPGAYDFEAFTNLQNKMHPSILKQGLSVRGYPCKPHETADEPHRNEREAACPDQQNQAGQLAEQRRGQARIDKIWPGDRLRPLNPLANS